MLQTNVNSELKFPWNNGEERIWAHGEIPLNTPWFYVACKLKERETFFGTTHIIFNLDQLKSLQDYSEISILNVYLVSPARMNGTNDWQMDILKEVTTGDGQVDGRDIKIDVFELVNGKKYLSNFSNNFKNIKNFEVVYKALNAQG